MFPWNEPTNFEQKIIDEIKIHTLREDKKDRWKEGNTIQFATGVRTKSYNNFKNGECKSTQWIIIYPKGRRIMVSTQLFGMPTQWSMSDDQIKELSINDGFDTVDDFWRWFSHNTVIRLKCIHWTSKKY